MFQMRNLYGTSHINASSQAASNDAARAESKTNSLQMEVKNLRSDLSRTLMICEALWEMLSEKAKLTETDLHKKLYEIDMRDGTLDGKNQRKARKCPDCEHMVSARHPACIYCGKVMDDSAFSM